MKTFETAGRDDIKSLSKLCFLLLFTIYCLRLLANNSADLDLWGYLAFGRLFWETGVFPYQDVFTYVPTHPIWIYHEWLTGVLYYPLYAGLGGWALQILKNILALSTLALIYLTARQRGADFWGAMVMLMAISGFLATFYSPVRAQAFSYFFFALTLYLLDSGRQTGTWARLGWLIPIQIIWSNMHGGFLAGLGLVGIYAFGAIVSRRPFWPYLGIMFLSGLATLVNPYGLDYWRYVLDAVAMPRPEIQEWTSTFINLGSGPYQLASIHFILIVYIALTLLWWSPFRDITAYAALATTLILGLKHFRHQVFFLLLTAAYLSEPFSLYLARMRHNQLLQKTLSRLDFRIAVIGYLIIFFFFSYRLALLQPFHLKTPAFSEKHHKRIYYPTPAVEFIQKNNFSGNLLSDFDWGEYLLWTLHPQCLIVMDGRYETVYPETVVRPYMDFLYGRPGWRRFLEEYPPDMILIKKNREVFKFLQEDPDWRQVFADAGSALFVRSEGRAVKLAPSAHVDLVEEGDSSPKK